MIKLITLCIIAMSPTFTPPNLHLIKETQAEREKRVKSKTFIPCQAEVADDRDSRIMVVQKCRQFGGTWILGYIAADECSKAGALRDVWISSRDQTQSRLLVEDCKWWNRKNKLAAKLAEIIIPVEEAEERAFQITYPATGRSIYSLSSNPDAQAGKRGHRMADEFALHKDQRRLYAILQPGLQWGGRMIFMSTHRGTNSFFNRELVQPALDPSTNKKKISLHTITIERAVRDGLWIKIRSQLEKSDQRYGYSDDDFLQSARDECPDEETWLQEYCCIPADDAAAFLPWDDITACAETAIERTARVFPPQAPRYVGFDVARKNDLSVITVLCEIGGVLIDEHVIVMAKTPFSAQERRLYEILDQENVRGARIDATGLGMQLAERAEARYPGKAQGVMFNMASKQELAFPLKARFEDRKIRIRDDRLYTADLRSVKKTVTSAGNIVITSEAGSTDGHADRFWSLALANMAASHPSGSTVYQAVKDHGGHTFGDFGPDEDSGLWLPRN